MPGTHWRRSTTAGSRNGHTTTALTILAYHSCTPSSKRIPLTEGTYSDARFRKAYVRTWSPGSLEAGQRPALDGPGFPDPCREKHRPTHGTGELRSTPTTDTRVCRRPSAPGHGGTSRVGDSAPTAGEMTRPYGGMTCRFAHWPLPMPAELGRRRRIADSATVRLIAHVATRSNAVVNCPWPKMAPPMPSVKACAGDEADGVAADHPDATIGEFVAADGEESKGDGDEHRDAEHDPHRVQQFASRACSWEELVQRQRAEPDTEPGNHHDASGAAVPGARRRAAGGKSEGTEQCEDDGAR